MKKVPVVRITAPDAAAELADLPLSATVAMADVAAVMREGLLAFSTAAGLVVMQQMLTEELTAIVGAKHAKLGSGRVGNWHGTTTGQVVLGSQKVTVSRPRGRYVDGGEVELATWETFASEDLSPIRPRASRHAGISPASSTARTPTPQRRCAKGWRRCSPSPASASPVGSASR
jgi:hypothetical protein